MVPKAFHPFFCRSALKRATRLGQLAELRSPFFCPFGLSPSLCPVRHFHPLPVSPRPGRGRARSRLLPPSIIRLPPPQPDPNPRQRRQRHVRPKPHHPTQPEHRLSTVTLLVSGPHMATQAKISRREKAQPREDRQGPRSDKGRRKPSARLKIGGSRSLPNYALHTDERMSSDMMDVCERSLYLSLLRVAWLSSLSWWIR